MKKILGIVVLGFALTFLQSCSSTGVKDISQLSAPSSTEANVYFKRTGGFVLGGTRAIIKIDGATFGSLYPNDLLKINVQPGNKTLTVAGDPMAGVFGKIDIIINLKAGKSYYFITGVKSGCTKFGFELTAESGNNKAGDFIITDNTTKLTNSNNAVTHKSSGTSGNSTKSWSMDWTPTANSTGSTTFYAALMFANGNGNDDVNMWEMKMGNGIYKWNWE